MKKLFASLSVLLAIVTVGCSDDEGASKSVVLTGGTQTSQTVYADETQSAGGGISFTATADWVATVTDITGTKAGGSSVEWLTLSAYSGGAGEYTLTLTLKENQTGADRKARIEIACGGDVITITVEQKGTTAAGDTPAPTPRGKRLARLDYTSIDSENPDNYSKYILTFSYDSEGRLQEMHDISYDGDEQSYYSDDVYTFSYEGSRMRLVQVKDDCEPRTFVMHLNEAGDIALFYQESEYSSLVNALMFSYDNDGYLQQILEDYMYEPEGENDGDDDDDVPTVNPGYDPSMGIGTKAFDVVKLNLTWKDGNLMSTIDDEGSTVTWEYTSYANETPGLDFNVLSARPLFDILDDTYTEVVNMLYGLRLLGKNSKNLVKADLVDWLHDVESPVGPSEPERPAIDYTYDDSWAPYDYTFTAENYLSRVTARATLRVTAVDTATGEVISKSESYIDDEYLFTYE